MSLNDLMSRAEASSISRPKQMKRLRVEEIGQPIGQMLLTALMNIWSYCHRNPIDKTKIEIEARLGMILSQNQRWQAQNPSKTTLIVEEDRRCSQNLEFKAGIDHIFLVKHLINKILIPENEFTVVSKTNQCLRSNNSSLRWEIDSTSQIKLCERKERFFRWNYALLASEYDIRIDGSVELEVNPSDTNIEFDKWTQERTKNRTTYVSAKFPCWKVDVTEVHVIRRDLGARNNLNIQSFKEYEVEFELDNLITSGWLNMTVENDAAQEAFKLANMLEALIDFCIPYDDNQQHDELKLELCRNEYISGIKALNTIIINNPSINNNMSQEFIGSMPFNISRNTLNVIKENDYFITEKSDGMRYLMYIVHDMSINNPVGILMNRSKEVYRLPDATKVGNIFKSGTVLDCEYVFNRTLKEHMILIFDILAMDGKSCVDLPFHQRLQLLDNEINLRVADYIRSAAASALQSKYLKINRKKYLMKSDIQSLLLKIRYEHGERVYMELPDGRRHHKTDGIIFQPANSKYQLYSDSNLLKWKWSDLRSVDLIAVENKVTNITTSGQQMSNGPIIQLFCQGPDNTSIDCTKRGGSHVGLSLFDSFRLLADINDTSFGVPQTSGPSIVEVMYDVDLGHWKYMRLRRDKTKPNFIDTVMSVFIEQAEDISIEELEYNIVADPRKTDFQSQIQEKKSRLINEVRYENKKRKNQSNPPVPSSSSSSNGKA